MSGFAKTCSSELEQIQISLAASSPETNLGYSSTTRKQRQSQQWTTPNSPRPKKARMSKLKIKTILITFFDQKGLVYHEFVPQDQTLNMHFYQQVLNRLNDRVRRCRPALWKDKSWMLHHDNAPAHTAFSVRQLLTNKQVAMLNNPPYSPDLAPCDFWFFPKLKSVVKGVHFASVEDIKDRMTRELRCLAEEDFVDCFGEWQGRMIKCSNLGENILKGTIIFLVVNFLKKKLLFGVSFLFCHTSYMIPFVCTITFYTRTSVCKFVT